MWSERRTVEIFHLPSLRAFGARVDKSLFPRRAAATCVSPTRASVVRRTWASTSTRCPRARCTVTSYWCWGHSPSRMLRAAPWSLAPLSSGSQVPDRVGESSRHRPQSGTDAGLPQRDLPTRLRDPKSMVGCDQGADLALSAKAACPPRLTLPVGTVRRLLRLPVSLH
jgi:hypothetical protein